MKLVTVYTSISVNEVHFVKSLLEGSGIEAVILDEAIGQLAPHHLFGQGGPRLQVPEEHVEEAKEIIDHYEKSKQE